jgi:hypothetical protein
MAIPSQNTVMKIDFGGSLIPITSVVPKKRSVQMMIASNGGRSNMSPGGGANYFANDECQHQPMNLKASEVWLIRASCGKVW